MERTLANFVRALRASDVRISTAETLDAFRTAEIVGWRDREALKEALAVTLPKTRDEKHAFDACFDTFFRFEEFQDAPPPEGESSEEAGEPDGSEQGEGDGGGGGGEAEGKPQGGGGEPPARPFEGNPEAHSEAEDAADLEELLHPGEMSAARSKLGQLLMDGDRTETAVQISSAAGEVGVENIQFFTQKGVYTRKIMDAMGNAELQDEILEAGRGEDIRDRRLAQELRRRREALREQIRDYVERQFLLHADVSGDRLREEILRQASFPSSTSATSAIFAASCRRWRRSSSRPTRASARSPRAVRSTCRAHCARTCATTATSSICSGSRPRSRSRACSPSATCPAPSRTTRASC